MLSCFIGLNAYAVKTHQPSAGKLGRSKKAIGKIQTPKTVFGNYVRQQEFDSSEFPTRAFGLLTSANGNCTGTLISSRHILTAAHCVYDIKTSTWSKEVKFYPGSLDESTTPYGEIKATKFFIHQGFIDEQEGYDYAVIELEKSIGKQLGWIGMQTPDEDMANFVAKITGYPGDKDYGTMWKVDCPARIASGFIIHECDSFGGMSGSTIRAKNNNEYIVGVHTSGSTNFNLGVVLNDERYDLIMSWITKENTQEVTVTHDNYFPPKQTFDRVHFKNLCSSRVSIVVHYKNLNGDWVNEGPWRLASGEEGYLFDTANGVFYYYAVGPNGEKWSGDQNVRFGDVLVPMKQFTNSNSEWGDYTINLSCD